MYNISSYPVCINYKWKKKGLNKEAILKASNTGRYKYLKKGTGK